MPREISISGSNIKLGSDRVFFIAEIGKNFIITEEERPVSEYLENAIKLVDLAVEFGADAVKFQTHVVEDEQLPVRIVAPHFKAKDRLAWVTRNEKATPLEDFWRPLAEHARSRDVIFFSAPMSRMAAEKFATLDVPLWKVGSADVTDRVMLSYMKSTGKPIILSTGMVSRAELHSVINYLGPNYPLVILFCVSQYPAPAESFNLASIEYIKEIYPQVVVGFSDHSIGFNDIALAAIKMGACVIEKHFSFSRELWGADHKVSMVPIEFKALVSAVRQGEYRNVDPTPYYGDREREFDGAINQFRPYFNKTLVAGRDIKRGEKITAEMVYAMRPKAARAGLGAEFFELVLGKTVTADLAKYEAFGPENIK